MFPASARSGHPRARSLEPPSPEQQIASALGPWKQYESIPQFRSTSHASNDLTTSDYPFFSTTAIDSSSASMATSASSLVTMSGGAMRTVLGPQPRNKTPRSNASSTMRSRSRAPYSRVFWSFTISTPIIRPRPRTSPTILCFFGQSAMRFSMWAPTSCEFFSSPSFSITSSVASAAAMQTGLPPKVDACEPGPQSMMSALLMVMPRGIPEAMPLAMQPMAG